MLPEYKTYCVRSRPRFHDQRGAAAGLALTLIVLAGQALAAPLLRCQIDQGGTTIPYTVGVVQDPYPVPSVDINGRFRFKALMVGDGAHVDYVKIYVYDNPRRQPVMIQYAKYLQPVLAPNVSQADAPSQAPAPFTGVQTVYSPRLERELKYQCTLVEAQP